MNDSTRTSHDNNSSTFINVYNNMMDRKQYHSSPSIQSEMEPLHHHHHHSEKKPKVVQWTPHQGHVDDTLTVILEEKDHEITLPMKLAFNNMILETTQQRQQKNQSIWTTLLAKIPRLESIQQQQENNSNNNNNGDQVQLAICTYDQSKDHIVNHWHIGTFTYVSKNKRSADDDILYDLDSNLYAKKAHTDYIDSSVGFGEGDIMNLITPYNQTQVSTGPSTTSIMENIATSNEPLQKSITKSPEINAGYSPILQRTNNSANTSTTTTIPPPSPTNSTITNSLVDAQYQQSGKQDQDQTQPQKRSKQKNDMNLAPPYQQQQPQQHHQQLPPQIMPRSSIPFPPPTSSYYNSNSYSLAYPPYPTNQQQQQQPPPMYIQPNTGNYGSHYFPPSQYNYGDESYMNPSGIPSNTPVSPPLQHQSHHQKLISPSTHPSSHHHHQHHPPTLLPYGVPPSQQHQQQQQQQPVLSKLTEPNYQDIHQHPHPFAGIVSRPHLNIHGDLMAATMNWTTKEWDMRRRVLRFWRQQQPNSHQIDCGYEVLDEELYRSQRLQLQQETGGDVSTTGGNTASSFKDNLVVSCIYWQERNDFFITSVDCIQLIEGLIGVEFTVEEKNRIRRNLEALRPLTAAKTRPESVEFFKLIMSFPSPKPRNIEKDVKVFLWSTLGPAIKKIVGKYTPSYSSTASIVHYDHHQPQQQRNVSGHMSRG